jgi:hypothetical protein
MIDTEKGVIFDDRYVDGLLSCALREGYLTFRCESESEKSWLDSYVAKIKFSPFKRKSLEMSLLFEKVYLHDPPYMAMLDSLQKEGIVASWKIVHDSPRLFSTEIDESVPQTMALVKPLLIKRLRSKLEHTLRFQEFNRAVQDIKKKRIYKRWFIHEYISKMYDIGALVLAGLAKEAPGIDIIESRLDDLHEESGYPINPYFILTYAEICEFISLIDMSRELQAPFCTGRVDLRPVLQKEVDALYSAYKLCLVPLQEEVKYAPVVESVTDLLRLREKKEVIRFREVLNVWKEALLSGETNLANRIRADILKANKEITRLEKWRQVDRWLYYLALPTAFVPYLSNAITIASVGTRRHIERVEKIHGWIGIGR